MERDQYNEIFDNGLAHIVTAELLARCKKFGFAISHLVLGIEELIKYQVVQFHSGDNSAFTPSETNPNHKKSIFRFHSTKHNLIREFQEAISSEFSKNFDEYILRKFTGQEFDAQHEKVARNRFKEIGSFLGSAYSEVNLNDDEKKQFFTWLDKANELKNRGFYANTTDYKKVQSPNSLTFEDYQLANKFARVILKQTKVIKDLDTTDEEFVEFLNSESIEPDEKIGS
ncbi:MAG: AbiV family abortive infection protein [Cyclobacteriaceae bacterium]